MSGNSHCNSVVLLSHFCVVLQGENLNLAAGESEFLVTIGQDVCVVESVNADKLFCRPPEDQPQPENPGGGYSTALPAVRVHTCRFALEMADKILFSRLDFFSSPLF